MPPTHITYGSFYADIIRDKDAWDFVVQCTGSADILALGSCDSELEAKQLAIKTMRELASKATGCKAA